MACTEFLKARVSPEIKLRTKAVADREFLSEAAWLKRLVLREIRACDAGQGSEVECSRAESSRRASLRGDSTWVNAQAETVASEMLKMRIDHRESKLVQTRNEIEHGWRAVTDILIKHGLADTAEQVRRFACEPSCRRDD